MTFQQLESRLLLTVFIVAPGGSDTFPGTLTQPLATIQQALNLASHPGDTVAVRGGTYAEHLTIPHSGTAAGYITLQDYNGEHVLLTGKNAKPNDTGLGNNMIQIVDQSYVQITGLEIADDSGVTTRNDAIGIRVQGSGSHIVIKNNVIHDITGKITHRSGSDVSGFGGAAIQVYGASTKKAYRDITIKNNEIYNCQPGDDETETVTLNGNIDGFLISHNSVHDCNNIGIDMIGGEPDTFGLPEGTKNLPVTRNGRCVGNHVSRIHANYGDGYAGGIYVDGGQNILVDENITGQNDIGIEVGAENAGYTATGITVQDNLIDRNTQVGLAIGGYAATTGRVADCRVLNNTIAFNDTTHTGSGQLLLQYVSGSVFTNNIITASNTETLIGSDDAGNTGNILDYNLYDAPQPSFAWNASTYSTFKAYRSKTSQDAHSIFADPGFTNAAANVFTLLSNSPAIGRGTAKPGRFADVDINGVKRSIPPDIGAF